MAAEGANVTLVARNEEKLQAVLSELPNTNQKHGYIVADFSNPIQLKSRIEASHLDFHILVNNTGGPAGGPVFDATLEAFEEAFTQHLKCNHILVQALVPHMKSLPKLGLIHFWNLLFCPFHLLALLVDRAFLLTKYPSFLQPRLRQNHLAHNSPTLFSPQLELF